MSAALLRPRLTKLLQPILNISKFQPSYRLEANVKPSVLLAVMKSFQRPIPDHRLSQLNTLGDLEAFLNEPQPMPRIVGIPALELFAGQAIPPNVTLINYRKKKWNDEMAAHFVRKQLAKAPSSLKPDSSVSASSPASASPSDSS